MAVQYGSVANGVFKADPVQPTPYTYGTSGNLIQTPGAKPGTPGSGVAPSTPPQPTSSPTVISDANVRDSTIPDITQRTQAALQTNASGVVQGTAPQGSSLSANGNYVDKAGNQYSGAPASVGSAGAVTGAAVKAAAPTATAPAAPGADTTQAPENDYDAFLKSIFSDNPSTSTEGAAPASDPYLTMLSTMKATSDAATQKMIEATQKTFAQRSSQLDATQQSEHAGLMQEMARNGESRYAPLLAGGRISADEQSHILALSDIDAQEGAAVAQLQKAQSDQDFQTMGKWLDHLDSLRTDKINVASKLADSAAAATKALNDAKQKVTDSINQMAQDLAKNNAPADVISAVTSSPDLASAITAGAGYFQDPTTPAGQYNAYVTATKAKGLTPMTPGDFLAKQASDKSFSDAYSSEAGKINADNTLGGPSTDTGGTIPDPGATGITGATGLSFQAFNYLTQGTASMSRMPAAQRNAIMKEANDWLTKSGTDISTFQSQYKAANTVLQQNIERENNVKTRGNEVTSTVDSLISDIGAKEGGNPNDPIPSVHPGGMSSLRAANVLDIIAGNATNNPFAEKYSTQIGFLANDLAGYLAASRGASSPDDSDKRDAANMVANGMNKGSLTAFKESVQSNIDKTAKVVENQTTSSKRQVWDTFGVADQFDNNQNTSNAKSSVDDYVKQNPDKAETIAKLYEVPGATDADVLEYIQSLK